MKKQMGKGDEFNHSYAVSQGIYDGFISLFEDRNPLHTDKTFANGKGFKDKVMHGNILNGFISHFVGELLPVKNVILQSQEIKYYKPVYLGDQLLFNAIIDDVYESVNTVEFKFRFSTDTAVKVAAGKIWIGII
jgi:3-hydroxybutyryl-CoA dehydratase